MDKTKATCDTCERDTFTTFVKIDTVLHKLDVLVVLADIAKNAEINILKKDQYL